MSRTKGKQIEPAKEVEIITELRCDLCGRLAENSRSWRPWATHDENALETDIHLKTGYSYPEGGSGEETIVDICPTCFSEKLLPWVCEQGGTPTVEEWET